MESSSSSSKDDGIPWDSFDRCVRGGLLLKYGRAGAPHFREFLLSADLKSLTWVSEKKNDKSSCRIELLGCRLVHGQTTDVFARLPRPELAHVSFSLLYEGGKRTLDVVTKDTEEYKSWTLALGYLTRFSPPAEKAREEWRRKGWSTLEPRFSTPGGGGWATSTQLTASLKDRMKDSGDVFAWGRGSWGELGLGDEGNRLTPCLIKPLLGSSVRSISCGGAHCIALTQGGEVYSWGHGGSGRLGIGSTDHVLSPQQVFVAAPGGAGGKGGGVTTGGKTATQNRIPLRLKAVAAGDMHTVGVDKEGCPWSWGCGGNGQLGLGGSEDALSPQKLQFFIASSSPASAAANAPASSSSSSSSASGVGTTYQVLLAKNVTSVAAGSAMSAFLDEGGRLFSCGRGDGPLGLDLEHLKRALLTDHPTKGKGEGGGVEWGKTLPGLSCAITSPPTSSSSSSSTRSATGSTAALSHSDLESVEGIVAGFIFAGSPDLSVPIQVTFEGGGVDTVVVDVSCGESHAVACTEDGGVYTWGWGGGGALGCGVGVDENTKVIVPEQIKGGALKGRRAVKVVAGGGHCLAIVEEGFGGDEGGGGHSENSPSSSSSSSSSAGTETSQTATTSHSSTLEGSASSTTGMGAPMAPLRLPPTTPTAAAAAAAAASAAATKRSTSSLVLAWGANSWGQCGTIVSGGVGGGGGGGEEEEEGWEEDQGGGGKILYTPHLVDLPLAVAGGGVGSGGGGGGGGGDENSGFNGEGPDSTTPTFSSSSASSFPFSLPTSGIGGTPSSSSSAATATSSSNAAAFTTASGAPPYPTFIAAGAFHSAVITSDNRLYVFGNGENGELGLGPGSGASDAIKVARACKEASSNALAASLAVELLGGLGEEDRGGLGGGGAGGVRGSRFFPWGATSGGGGGGGSGGGGQISLTPTFTASFTPRGDKRRSESFYTSSTSDREVMGGVSPTVASYRAKVLANVGGEEEGNGGGGAFAVAGDSTFISLPLTPTTPGSSRKPVRSSQSALKPIRVPIPSLPAMDLRPRSLIYEHRLATSAPGFLAFNGATATNTGSGGAGGVPASNSDGMGGLDANPFTGLNLDASSSRRLLLSANSAAATATATAAAAAANTSATSAATSLNKSGNGMAAGGGGVGAVAHSFALSPPSNSSKVGDDTTTPGAGAGAGAGSAAMPTLTSTALCGPLPVLSLAKKLVRWVACGEHCTLATVATEWLSDEDARACVRCRLAFSFTRRRHHCRRCGGVFCKACSDFRVPLLALGYIQPVRVCGPCHEKETGSKS